MLKQELILRLGRSIYVCAIMVMWFIFFGVMLQGIIDLMGIRIPIDYVFALIYLFLGLVMSLGLAQELRRLYSKDWREVIKKKWNRNKVHFAMTTVLFILLYLFRFQISSFLLFVGYEIGRFLIRPATSAYLEITGMDLDDINFHLFAWLFQWHFLYAFLILATSIGRRVSKLFAK